MEILLLVLFCVISGAAIAFIRRGIFKIRSRSVRHSSHYRANHDDGEHFESRTGIWGALSGLVGAAWLFGTRDHTDHFESSNLLGSSHELQSTANWADDGHLLDDSMSSQINPANGLPMVGAIDIEGNPYGTDSSMWDDTHTGFDMDDDDHFNHDFGGMDHDSFHSDF